MKIKKIPKRNGEYRIVHCPTARHKKRLRKELLRLHKIMEERCDMGVVHGFAIGRSPVTNALAHVGPYAWTVSMDLKDFFDSVTDRALRASIFLEHELERLCMYGLKAAPQGFPTAPLTANIAFAPYDEIIQSYCRSHSITYTRYADDLSFSGGPETDPHALIKMVKDILRGSLISQMFKINERKTRIQYAKQGKRIITGIAVDDKGIYPTRATRRRLRAALHQGNHASAGGLQEWSALKQPSGKMSQTPGQTVSLPHFAKQRLTGAA